MSDYTRQVACGLAQAGQVVTVFAPSVEGRDPEDPGVRVQRLDGGFCAQGLKNLSTHLRALPAPQRLLLQYVPHAFGWKGMNLPFCRWLVRHRGSLWVMFHEIAFPRLAKQSIKHRLLAGVQRRMAALLARRAERIFVSTSAWNPILHELAGVLPEPIWLPVPSNLPLQADPRSVQMVRSGFPAGARLLGHFGTYGDTIRESLESILPAVLEAEPDVVALLLGQGGDRFAANLAERHPSLARRMKGTGALPPESAAAHLAACDLLVQPYPDGATTRRGSLMAGLALGLPLATTEGELSEPLWSESGAVALVPCGENCTRDLSATCLRLLADPAARQELAHKGLVLYKQRFAIERTLEALLAS